MDEVKIHSHRHCIDCGRFIKTVRCGRDHTIIKGYLCDACYDICVHCGYGKVNILHKDRDNSKYHPHTG